MGKRDVREIIARLRREGWKETGGKGSHKVFRKPGRSHVSVPAGRSELPVGTYENIARKAGWR
ncbi:MAG TPA: addiction module toxin, HicA family [Coriobacteriia bacterium]|nr:addiction module toxin, HicA family [Coriobacteriia bacterium]